MNTTGLPFRASPPLAEMMGNSQFGLLINLAGTWMGRGFNLVSLPLPPQSGSADPFKPRFIPKIGATQEVLVVAPLGAPIPNRGFVQEDIFLFGLSYLQVVSDAASSEARHFETGLWLNVPDTPPPNVVRQAVIPHGDSLLASGIVTQAKRSTTHRTDQLKTDRRRERATYYGQYVPRAIPEYNASPGNPSRIDRRSEYGASRRNKKSINKRDNNN